MHCNFKTLSKIIKIISYLRVLRRHTCSHKQGNSAVNTGLFSMSLSTELLSSTEIEPSRCAGLYPDVE